MVFSFTRGLSIVRDGKPIIEGLSFWICPQSGERTVIPLINCTENCAEFSDEAKTVTAALRISKENNVAGLHLEVSYYPVLGNTRGQNHLDIEHAAGIDIEKLHFEKAMVNYMRCNFWCGTKICSSLSEIPQRTQAMLIKLHSGEYMYLLTACGDDFKSNIEGNESGCSLFVYSHYPQNRCSTCALIFAFGNDPYILPTLATEYGLRVMNKPGRPRRERRFPEIFEYLGWCSWDAFQMDVSHEGLAAKAQEFKDKGIPVRWMLIDDMWAECPNNNLATMHSRELRQFEGDPQRFPGGMRAAISELKEKFGMKVGVWHPTTGYWNGIDPDGAIAEKHRDLLAVALNGKLIPAPSFEKSFKYYYLFHSFLRECGADFVKVDNQSFINEHYSRLIPIGQAARNLHQAIEASAGVNFDGTIINCMGMAIENFWNRPQSSVIRISGDFLPENRKWFIQHLIQCSYNAFVYGSLYTGDWDMWWSDDGQATKNAVLRAMSGGPVYMSDKLGRSVGEKILPIVYKDGRIIRLKQPAIPSADCLLEDPEQSGKIYKIFNRAGKAGLLAAFNLDEKESAVYGTVSASDVYGLGKGRYVLFDYFAKAATILEEGEEYPLTLKDYDDFRLFFLLPLDGDIVPVGLLDKYISPATFEVMAPGKWLVHEGGTFCIFSAANPPAVLLNGKPLKSEAIGEMLFAIELPDQNGPIFLELD